MSAKETFKSRLLGLQGNLLNFAYQLTTNREAAEDLLQDTTLKALDNEDKYVDTSTSRDGFSPSCATSSLTTIARLCARPL